MTNALASRMELGERTEKKHRGEVGRQYTREESVLLLECWRVDRCVLSSLGYVKCEAPALTFDLKKNLAPLSLSDSSCGVISR